MLSLSFSKDTIYDVTLSAGLPLLLVCIQDIGTRPTLSSSSHYLFPWLKGRERRRHAGQSHLFCNLQNREEVH